VGKRTVLLAILRTATVAVFWCPILADSCVAETVA